MKPQTIMCGYGIHEWMLSDFIKGLYPDEIEWWERSVSARAFSKCSKFGESAIMSDMVLWVPRHITQEELLDILAKAEKDVEKKIERARIYGSPTRRALAELQAVQAGTREEAGSSS